MNSHNFFVKFLIEFLKSAIFLHRRQRKIILHIVMIDEIRSKAQKGVPVNNNNWEVVLPLEYSFLEAVRFLKAPAFILWRVFFAQISFLVVLFLVLLWYFNSQTISQTVNVSCFLTPTP